MTPEEAIKRLRQETCAATYNPDFDKDQCLQVLENKITRLAKLERYLLKWQENLKRENINSKGAVAKDIDYLIEEKEKN